MAWVGKNIFLYSKGRWKIEVAQKPVTSSSFQSYIVPQYCAKPLWCNGLTGCLLCTTSGAPDSWNPVFNPSSGNKFLQFLTLQTRYSISRKTSQYFISEACTYKLICWGKKDFATKDVKARKTDHSTQRPERLDLHSKDSYSKTKPLKDLPCKDIALRDVVPWDEDTKDHP